MTRVLFYTFFVFFFFFFFDLLGLHVLCSSKLETINEVDTPDSLLSVYAQASWNQLNANLFGFGRKHSKGSSKGSTRPVLITSKQTLDLNRAEVAASLASISYCYDFASVERWNCTRCHLAAEFVLEKSIVDEDWDVHCIVGYYPPWDARVIAFRGTDSSHIRNWIENLRATQHQVRLDLPGLEDCRVHNGFSRVWNIPFKKRTLSALETLTTKYSRQSPLYIIGHSAGGATAQLAALTIKLLLDEKDIRLYTFGAPRVGNKDFAQRLTQLMTESWRFTHARDIVPTLPWMSMGFWHTAQEVFQNEYTIGSHKVITGYNVCDGTGEDPNGHNGMCPYGFGCNSISDHLFYMGRIMENDGVC
eukprot:g4152.t1